MLDPLLLSVRQLRRTLISLALDRQAPPPNAQKRVMELAPQISRANLDDRQSALFWGELQMLMVEAEGQTDDAMVWGPVRNAANAGLVALLKRKEWGGLGESFAKMIFPRLASAVNVPRPMRITALIDVTTRLRALADRPTGQAHRWLLRHIAEMQYPRFGTSGWRARMGVDFTWHRATAVAQAIVEFVLESGVGKLPLAIGYDSRINADRVAAHLAEIAVANGLDVHLAERETPSPALIFYITELLGPGKNAGLINCTPSHNPVKDVATRQYLGTEYHGIRYNMPYGAVAPTRATDTIGRRAMELLLEETIVPVDKPRGTVTYFDPLDAYAGAMVRDLAVPVTLPNGSKGDAVTAMRNFWGAENAIVVIDEMHSASRGYLRAICDRLKIRYTVLHGEKDPLLGELLYANPEEPHIERCAARVQELRERYPVIIGFGADTDSDRFGVVDERGHYMMTNQLLPMLAHYLLTAAYSGQPGRIIRNMVTTRLLDRVAEGNRAKILPPADLSAVVLHATLPGYQVALGNPAAQSGFLTHLVPVGFKYIADVMMQELQAALATGESDPGRVQKLFDTCLQKLLLAGEESNGMTSRGHTPDKDGLWAILLTLQMCAVRAQLPTALWDETLATYGKLVSVRRDMSAPDAAKEALVDTYLDRCAEAARTAIMPEPSLAQCTPTYCGGIRGEMVEIIMQDEEGRESYLAIRASGTEPINRIYVESPDEGLRDAILLAVGQELEACILHAISQATDVMAIVDLLDAVELPPAAGADLPATFTPRVTEPACERIRALTGPKAAGALYDANQELARRNPAKAGVLV
jgi:phosphoglucomutase